MSRTLILSDNAPLLRHAIDVCFKKGLAGIEFACSERTSSACDALASEGLVRKRSIKTEHATGMLQYSLIISLHCRQVFPASLVEGVRCINFHPGFNPYNRGWFPHVFSLMNALPAGITIHEMDDQIDHGPIIHQEQIHIDPHEVSSDIYQRIIDREKALFELWIERLIEGRYTTRIPANDGNYHSKADFEKLKEIRLDQATTPREFLNYLRAMTFEGYKNAWFEDQETRKRYFVTIKLERDQKRS